MLWVFIIKKKPSQIFSEEQGTLLFPSLSTPLQHPPETLPHTYQGEANKAAVFFQITQKHTRKLFRTFLPFSTKCIKYTALPSMCMHPPFKGFQGSFCVNINWKTIFQFLCQHSSKGFSKPAETPQVKASIIDKFMVIKPKETMKVDPWKYPRKVSIQNSNLCAICLLEVLVVVVGRCWIKGNRIRLY